jgi:hypothetical protein
MAIGSPPQRIRVIPSLAQNVVTVVRPEECLDDKYGFKNCSSARGGVFHYGNSSTWISSGDSTVDPAGNGLFKRELTFGTDDVGVGHKPVDYKMRNTTIGLMHNPYSSYLNIIGISPVPVNLTEDHRVTPTFFEALRTTARIASKTVAYTAGSYNRKFKPRPKDPQLTY